MPILPLCVTGLISGFMAHLVSQIDRGQPLMRLANYPVGVLAATFATWISQNVPNMHNKLLVLGMVVPAIALLLYHAVRYLLANQERFFGRFQIN